MRFGLSDEQETFRDQLRRLLAERARLARVREVAAEGTGFDERLWSGLTELGAMGVMVPEEYGGLGLGAFDGGIVLEELGRFVAPAPYLTAAFVAPLVLAESTSNSVAAEWLPRIAGGEAKIGLALAEVVGARAGAGVSVRNGRLSGKALAVQDSGAADAFLVASGRDSLWLVPAGASGLSKTPMISIDRTRALSELKFDNTEAEPVAGGEALVQRALDLARIGLALDSVGAADAMFEQAVEYSKQRVQFERVIGSFQGVKHSLADMITALEPARALVWYAAHAQTAMPRAEAHRLACHAKAHMGKSAAWLPATPQKSMAAWASPMTWACTIGSSASVSTANCWDRRSRSGRKRQERWRLSARFPTAGQMPLERKKAMPVCTEHRPFRLSAF